MKVKVISIIIVIILLLGCGIGYYLYNKDKTKLNETTKQLNEISKIEKAFWDSNERNEKLNLLKGILKEKEKYNSSSEKYKKVLDKYDECISSMQSYFITEYDKIIEENAPHDIGNSDDIDTLANHKDTLNILLTTIESEKEYTLPNDSDYQTYVENLSSWTEAYASRISDIEEKQKAETEAQKKAREEAEKQAEEAANKMPEKENNTHYENEYFSVDVPTEWSGNWSVNEGPNYRENSNAVAVYEANVDISGGKGAAEIYVLEMKYPTDRLGYGNFTLPEGGTYVGETSNNKFVFIMSEASYGFFSAGATITLK